MTCPHCTLPVAGDFQSCPACGTKLEVGPGGPDDFNPAGLLPAPLALHTSGKAIASLVCGIFWVCGLGSIAALVLGYFALREIRRNPLQIAGKGMAIAGIILGYLGVAGLAFVLILGIHVWNGQRDHPRKPRMRQADITVVERRTTRDGSVRRTRPWVRQTRCPSV